MSELSEKLDKIKREKEKKRLEKLNEICIDSDMINDALEIAKHESSIHLPGIALIMASAALMVGFFNNPVSLSYFPPYTWVVMYLIVIFTIFYVAYLIQFQFNPWKRIYYDLVELRRNRIEETNISKLDIIIFKVKEINPKIDVLEKSISTKLEAIEKDIKRRKWG